MSIAWGGEEANLCYQCLYFGESVFRKKNKESSLELREMGDRMLEGTGMLNKSFWSAISDGIQWGGSQKQQGTLQENALDIVSANTHWPAKRSVTSPPLP